jgi:hypothetical protein
MNRPEQRQRRADQVRLADQPNQLAGYSRRSAVFVVWDGYSAGATRTPWPTNDVGSADGMAIGVGHRHLCRLLLVHDMLSQQGVTKASGMLSEYEITDAIDACTYFDLPDLAAAVSEIPMAASSPIAARVFDAEYYRLFASTDRLMEAILEQIATHPDDFPGSNTGR